MKKKMTTVEVDGKTAQKFTQYIHDVYGIGFLTWLIKFKLESLVKEYFKKME